MSSWLVGAARSVFTFPVALASSLAALAVLTVRSRFQDPDLWWHLRTGQIIWTERRLPRADLFSFSTQQSAWVPHEWLAQLTIFGSWKAAGDSGLMVWFGVLTAALLILEYRLCWLYARNAKIAFLGALAAWFFSTIGLAIRPQMLGYTLLVCELLFLELGRSRDGRWFLMLPPLFAVWVNCHGSFFLGLVLLGALLACAFVNVHAGLLVSRPWDGSSRKLLAWSAGFSGLAVSLNPVGKDLLAYPLWTMFDARMQLDAVSEWQRLAFDDVRALALVALTGLILLMPLLRRRELYLEELLWPALAFALAARHQRLLFACGIVLAPVVCRQLADFWEDYRRERDHPLWNAMLVAAALGTVGLAFPSSAEMEAQVRRNNPVEAVEFIRRTRLAGRMLNEYGYGGYLIWALPERKVFIDGRADVFAWSGVLRDYGAWATLEADPAALLDRYHIDFCVLSRAAPLARVLPYLPGWSEAYSDSQARIFVRSGARVPGKPEARQARGEPPS